MVKKKEMQYNTIFILTINRYNFLVFMIYSIDGVIYNLNISKYQLMVVSDELK